MVACPLFYGLKLRHLEPESLIRKIQKLQLFLLKPDTSKLVYTTMSWYQHVTDFSSPMLQHHSYSVSYINSHWFNDFFRLFKKYRVELNLQNDFIPKIQKENDKFIRDEVLNFPSSLSFIKKLHVYRLYIRVIFLFDLINHKKVILYFLTPRRRYVQNIANTNMIGNFKRSLMTTPGNCHRK